jgi:outer membrane receptor protein involved in Fe transport
LFKSQATLALDEAGHWRAALTARAISSRHLASRRLGGYALWNANLLWQPRANFEASLGVFNLGAKTYDDAPSSESANSVRHRGRAAALQLFWRLGS